MEIQPTETVVPKEVVQKTAKKLKAQPVPKVAKEKFNALMDKDLLERAKNISFFTKGVSLTDMVTEGLRIIVEDYEQENGGAFEKRTGKLKTGRKPKSVPTEPEPQNIPQPVEQNSTEIPESAQVEIEL